MDVGGDILWLAAALLASGAIAGLLAGLFGIGGGGILVPILYELFRGSGIRETACMQLAVGTSLAIIVPTAFRSFRAHYLRGAVDMRLVRSLGPAVAAGAGAGILVAQFASGSALKAIFAASSLAMAAKLLAGRDRWLLGTEMPGNPADALVGFAIGAISALIGIGGGVYVSAYMTLYRRPIHQAVATSSAFGPIIAIPAVAGYIWAGRVAEGLPPGSLGYVSLLGAALVAPASVLAAPIGVRIAHSISRRKLEVAFAVTLTAFGGRLIYTVLGP
jgi:uncharacterized membrane protein YfcA